MRRRRKQETKEDKQEEKVVMGDFGPEISLDHCDSQSSGIFSQVREEMGVR